MITFTNGQSFDTIRIIGAKRNYQGMERDTLEIAIPSSDITLEEAKKLWKEPELTKELAVTYDGVTSYLLNYSLPIELIVQTLKVSETETVEVVVLKLAQKSELEIAQEKQATDIAACEAAIIDIGELLGGE